MPKLKNIVPVILCGGSGTRLWPVSRRDYPKQFTHLRGDKSLFQDTLIRIDEVFEEAPVIITNQAMKFMAAHQMQEVNISGNIIAEPSAQNSGPAVLLSAFYAKENNKDCTVAVFASDHVIEGNEGFMETASDAKKAAEKGYIATFGVTPTEPSNAYGYISVGKSIDETNCNYIESFIEKPDTETAKSYLDKGYLWNSGNFVFSPDSLIDEYKKQDSNTVSIVEKSFKNSNKDIGMIIPHKDYSKAESLSIDYAVMEKTQKAAVTKANFKWSDAGTWKSLYDLADKDPKGNATFGQDIYLEEVENSYIHNDTNRLVAASGIDDITIMLTEDVLYVSKRDNSSQVKKVLASLKKDNRSEATTPNRVYRPWGWYESISMGGSYQVKRISVNQGASLSLQKHFHRAEHWVVVEGTAEVVNGDETLILKANQSTYIPKEAIHRLKNIGSDELKLIEVQSGDYLGEDDIVRLEDIYNRC